MSKYRTPFPWEAQPDGPEPSTLDYAKVLTMPKDGPTGPSVMEPGELDGVRETRAAQAARTAQHTDGSVAAQEWAAKKSERAAQTWDRGVRNGSIIRH